MTVTLTPELEKFIAEQLREGYYRSADEVIAQGVGILQTQELFIQNNVLELREKIESSAGQIERGEVVDGSSAIRSLREKLRKREAGNG
jgi:antitoxin ParD1/3/4